VTFLHDHLRATLLADRYWLAFWEAYQQTRSLGLAWDRLQRVVTRHKLMEMYGPVVRDLLAARVVARIMPPVEAEYTCEEAAVHQVPVDSETMRVIEQFRGPMSPQQFVKAAVYQLAYTRSRDAATLQPEE
jgi:hypothetical protein